MPEKETRCKLILQRLKRGGITSYEAYQDFGVTQLATRITELEQRGVKISRVWENGINRHGKPVRYKRYFLGGAA